MDRLKHLHTPEEPQILASIPFRKRKKVHNISRVVMAAAEEVSSSAMEKDRHIGRVEL